MSTRKHDVHSVASALKDLAAELGKASLTGLDLQLNRPGLKDAVYREFGSMAVALQAAGLETAERAKAKQKIDNSVFERDIVDHLEKYEPRPPADPQPLPHLAAISDIHWPFVKQRVVDRFYRRVGDLKPEIVVINGDARDFLSHAKFPRSHNVFTPREENAMARKQNADFWLEIKRLVPNARCIQTVGNHCVRPLKRMLESYPEAEDWIQEAITREFTFDGVESVMDPREEVVIGDIMIHHGYRTQLGAHRDFNVGYNFISGHTHRGGVVFKQSRGRTYWELNLGYAGDPEAKGLSYTSQKNVEWTSGFGWVDSDGPRFISVP